MWLRPPRPSDGPAITAIHAEGLATGHASFRDAPYDWPGFEAAHPLALVAEADGALLGWAAIGRVSARPVYAGVGEVSIYVAGSAARRGVGRALLSRLVGDSEAAGWWTLMAHVFPENAASIGLLATCGFERVGLRRRLGRMEAGPSAGRLRDVVMLERRSVVAGV